MLAQARTLDDIREIRDMAEAARAYATAAKLGSEAVNAATAVKLEAERKAGELLRKTPKQRPGDYRKRSTETSVPIPPTLSDLGVTDQQSSDWQALASVDDTEFAEILEEAQDEGVISTKRVVRKARDRQNERTATAKTERRAQPVDVPPPIPSFAYDREILNVWPFERCDPRFGSDHAGRMPGQVVANLLDLYTHPGEMVLDPFGGSGTTLDVCAAMGRQCLAFDLKPRRPDIQAMDALALRPQDVSELPALILLDPPYWTQKQGEYTGDAQDFSNLELDEFYAAIEQLARQLRPILAPGGCIALILSQSRLKGRVYDLAFESAKRFEYADYTLIERICVPYRNATSIDPISLARARDGNYLLRAYRDLMVFVQ